MKFKKIMLSAVTGLLLMVSPLTVNAEEYYTVYDKQLTVEQYNQFNEDLDKAQTADEVQAVFDKYGINQNVDSLIKGEAPKNNEQPKTEEPKEAPVEETVEEPVEETTENAVEDTVEEVTEDKEEPTVENPETESAEVAEEPLVVEVNTNYSAIIIGISVVLLALAGVLVILAIKSKTKK
jgi:hypothetical protein